MLGVIPRLRWVSLRQNELVASMTYLPSHSRSLVSVIFSLTNMLITRVQFFQPLLQLRLPSCLIKCIIVTANIYKLYHIEIP